MNLLSALILGLVQGLTEFLPISSSGHLVLAQYLLGIKVHDVGFDLILHLGTLLAVFVYFWADILELIASFTWKKEPNGQRWVVMIILATIPTALIGFIFKDVFEAMFGNPQLDALMLWTTGIILLLSDRVRTNEQSGSKIRTGQALIVGLAQGISIIPGISRSGATIAAGLFSGINRATAARFSFLLSIPAILGAGSLKAGDMAASVNAAAWPSLMGAIVAFLTGLASIYIVLKMVMRRRMWAFSLYLFILGALEILFTTIWKPV